MPTTLLSILRRRRALPRQMSKMLISLTMTTLTSIISLKALPPLRSQGGSRPVASPTTRLATLPRLVSRLVVPVSHLCSCLRDLVIFMGLISWPTMYTQVRFLPPRNRRRHLPRQSLLLLPTRRRFITRILLQAKARRYRAQRLLLSSRSKTLLLIVLPRSRALLRQLL